MEENLKHTSKSILDKRFLKSRNGYDSLEVDQFLDEIISDYQMIEKCLESLKAKLADLEERRSKGKEKINDLEIKLELAEKKLSELGGDTKVTQDNASLIRKINALEKFLYENGFDPSKII